MSGKHLFMFFLHTWSLIDRTLRVLHALTDEEQTPSDFVV